jgi:hypothetical protein
MDVELATFGQDVTYTPENGSPAFTLNGILDVGARREDAAPGTYALLFVKAASFTEPPVRGDEVTVGNSVYKVVDLEADAEGGIRLVLHFNRPA